MYEKSWLNAFQDAVNDLYDAIGQYQEADPTPEDAAEALAALHAIKGHFTLAWERMTRVAIESMGTIPEITLSDGTKVEKRNSSDRKSWNHSELAAQVAQRIQDLAVDMDTGERVLTTTEMIAALLDYVAPSYWRVKALGKIGIDADRYCEVSEGKPSIIVRKGAL